MMDGVPDLPALADLIAGMTPLPRYELRCGPGVITWLTLWLADPEADMAADPPGSIGRLAGVPMISDPELARGEWRILRDGEEEASGRLTFPDFVDRPFEIRFQQFPFPDVTDRFDWRFSFMPPLPPPAIGLSSVI
jgi:hypothetical protein